METNTQPFAFRKATKANAKLRLAFIGPAGSGKSYSSLAVARALVGPQGRIAAIDTERGSLSKYANDFQFDVLELEQHSPADYQRAIKAAEDAGYDVLVIDSLSHAWAGKGGALEMVDNFARKSQSGNSFGAWRNVTPAHNALVDSIIGAKLHVIATMRAKTEWVVERDERTGKQTPRKIGLAPVQRDGMEYEFDVVGDIDQQHSFAISKSRCSALADAVIEKPGRQMAETLRAWLAGPEAAPKTPAAPPAAMKQAQPDAPAKQEPSAAAPAPTDQHPVATPAAAPAAGGLAGVLAAFDGAVTEADLLEAAKVAKAAKLSKADAAVARKHYAMRQEQIRAAAHTEADRKLVGEAMSDDSIAQLVVDYAGSSGIDLSRGIEHATPAELANIAGWLRADKI